MTKEEIEELIGLAAGMGLYDDKNPGKRAVILGKAIKELQQEPCEDAISRQEMLKYFEGWKNQIKYYHPYAKNFDIPYEEAIQRIKDVPPVKCVSSEELCEDAISRQAAIDAIYACYIGGKEAVDKAPANDQYAEGIDEAVCAVEDLPPVNPQPKTDWIPVSERLPERSGWYLVSLKNGNVQKAWYRVAPINQGGSYWRGSIKRPIAWMPLPEPYKAEGSEAE